jgi:hypothetical protein
MVYPSIYFLQNMGFAESIEFLQQRKGKRKTNSEVISGPLTNAIGTKSMN